MSNYTFISALNDFASAMLKPGSWEELADEVKTHLIQRSVNDVSAYARNIKCTLTIEDEEFQSAIFEQTVFIAERYFNTENGKTILEENISGFASRRYKELANTWICDRAKAYLDAFRPEEVSSDDNNNNSGSGNNGSGSSGSSGSDNNDGTENENGQDEEKIEIPFVRFLR